MTIKRLDHISVVVEDIEAAIAFFTELGMSMEGKGAVEGDWVDRINGIKGIKADIVMMKAPDGHGQLELTKFHNPELIEITPKIAPPNALGLRSVMFTVEKLDDTVEHMLSHGGKLIGEVVQYENLYRLCYMRGPGDIIVSLAEELF
jgi:catechol 2,3-dioxygenase-like lactoylglutathione lyase family enzyme